MYMITDNLMSKNKFWGNSWLFAADYNVSKPNESAVKIDVDHQVGINIGRCYGKSFGGGGGVYITLASWGLGYSRLFKEENQDYVSGFVEVSAFPVPPVVFRMEYIGATNFQEHYIRPSIGLSFLALDLMYNYSIGFQTEKKFTHGFSLRFKLYKGSKKWEHTYPSRC